MALADLEVIQTNKIIFAVAFQFRSPTPPRFTILSGSETPLQPQWRLGLPVRESQPGSYHSRYLFFIIVLDELLPGSKPATCGYELKTINVNKIARQRGCLAPKSLIKIKEISVFLCGSLCHIFFTPDNKKSMLIACSSIYPKKSYYPIIASMSSFFRIRCSSPPILIWVPAYLS